VNRIIFSPHKKLGFIFRELLPQRVCGPRQLFLMKSSSTLTFCRFIE